ncbi:putative DNA modification/repair radical SAM protein [Clostridium swellfunianum]|uniref:putative DNA modification/repair radical SAM protein n=1 Tax=Clostridium swellfunianum TaxID=1367462 RepID=UPI00202EE592|nr:putative DNA modification/repair radical SAM protein [Clostridium swellfunianum]MCM0649697.1 putative DNA modification/repair radical SAM protein [Clostridium swellfunianum]
MDIQEKLKILSGAAKYDVSCSSSGSSRKNKPFGIGNASESGICHSFAADGRCISLLKILLTNYCVYDCAYCVNRSSNDVPRAAFTPEEIADLTINFYKRNYIEGLFLSSAVIKNANHTMELLLKTVSILRNKYNFNGYIHIKAIPGADNSLIKQAGELVDRMSVNVELPSNEGLRLLAPQKNTASILKPMSFIGHGIIANKEEKKLFKSAPSFVPAGQSTQLIIGATRDTDLKIMSLSENLYNNYNLKRVYYSAYVPVNHSSKLPSIVNPPLIREHRLYQADWLLRFYGFSANELLSDSKPNLDINFDPKTDWALSHIEQFPVEINLAPQKMLLRVPGIGVRSVKRIIAARKVHALTFEDLKKLGIVLKRAQYFITCRGKYLGDVSFKEDFIRYKLTPKKDFNIIDNPAFEQLTLFSGLPALYKPDDSFSSITGEL